MIVPKTIYFKRNRSKMHFPEKTFLFFVNTFWISGFWMEGGKFLMHLGRSIGPIVLPPDAAPPGASFKPSNALDEFDDAARWGSTVTGHARPEVP